MIPGEIIAADGALLLNAGQPSIAVLATNTGDVPIHLTAHFHVFEANPRLLFDRRRAFGMRLDVPSTGSVRIEPGTTVELRLIPIDGRRVVNGFNGAVDGALERVPVERALARLHERGFLHRDDPA